MNNLRNMLKKEIREIFRDKKSLMMMLIIPFFIPVIGFLLSFVFDAQTEKNISSYNKIGFNYKLTPVEKELLKKYDIDYLESTTKTVKDKYKKGKLDLYVIKKDNVYELTGEDNEKTTYASTLASSYFQSYKEYLQNNYLTERNINPQEVQNIIITKQKTINLDNYYKTFIINYGFIFIIMAITVSATYPATDTTAGEKERGTLETLLTFPIKSSKIIIGKYLSVVFSSIITGILSLLLLTISLSIAGNTFDIYKQVDLSLTLPTIIFASIVIIMYSFLISGLCILIASKSKTFKEAQSALTPLMFISMFPSMLSFMTNVESSTLLSLVPFLNFTLLFNDIVTNNVNILSIFLMIISTILLIIVIISIMIKQYQSEKILF